MANLVALTKEVLEKATINSNISGVVYIRYLKKSVSTKNVVYLSGELESKEKYSVVMWKSCQEFTQFENVEIHNQFAYIEAVVNEFAGKKSINLNHLQLLDNATCGFNVDDFKYTPYPKDVYSAAFMSLLQSHLSQKGYKIFETIFEPSKVDGLWSKFSVEYAAKLKHDNCESGLLAHTYKCLRLLEYLEKPYGFISKLQTTEIPNSKDISDLIYLGVALHDVGKVFELKEGLYVPDSFNTHRILGLEVLFKNHDVIVNSYNEHWYQALISILVGHHHDYDEKAKTLYAYVVYMIDNMESTFTGLNQLLTTNVSENVEGMKINWNDDILSL